MLNGPKVLGVFFPGQGTACVRVFKSTCSLHVPTSIEILRCDAAVSKYCNKSRGHRRCVVLGAGATLPAFHSHRSSPPPHTNTRLPPSHPPQSLPPNCPSRHLYALPMRASSSSTRRGTLVKTPRSRPLSSTHYLQATPPNPYIPHSLSASINGTTTGSASALSISEGMK